MHTFRVLDQQIGLVPAAIARTLGAIDTARGREDAFRMQRPQLLDALIDVARIQSTEASNAIEQVVAPRKRIEALVAQKTTPRNRSEAEIAGYRAVLDLIHEFTIADVRDASLGASDSLIGKVLARLRDEGLIEALGTGRSAKWRRLPDASRPG